VSISPQLRQLVAEVALREAKFFKREDKTFDTDAILASIVHSMENEYAQWYTLLASDSVQSAVRRIMMEQFRAHPKRFKTMSGKHIQGTLFLHLPDENGVFHVKETRDARVKELERKIAFHDAIIRGNARSRANLWALVEEARAQNLAEDQGVGDVLADVAGG
jgi:hypothetical protein